MLGEGILKGLGETARNFAGSFVSAERLTTVQYPEERIARIEATRDFPFLVYDSKNAADSEDWLKGTDVRILVVGSWWGRLAADARSQTWIASHQY